MKLSAKWISCILATIAPVLPLIVGVAVIRKLGTDSGVTWAHSLFTKDHVLNFGGNPAEVMSHLLDWIVMTGSMASLCFAAGAVSLLKAAAVGARSMRILPLAAFPLTLIVLTVLTHGIDRASGEGTLLLAVVMFFTPFLLAIAFALIKLQECNLGLKSELVPLPFLFAASFGLQWLYEPSESGAPNILVFPAFLVLAGALWSYCYLATRARQPQSIAGAL
jgi:hypothetical protein